MDGNYTEVTDNFRKIVTSNTQPFDVFAQEQLVIPEGKIAVADSENSLIPFLQTQHISFIEFYRDLPKTIPVWGCVSRIEKIRSS